MSSPAVPSAVMSTYWPQDHGIKILKYGTLPLEYIGIKVYTNITCAGSVFYVGIVNSTGI